MKKVLLVATVQSHICQFHKPFVEVLHEKGVEVHVAARNNLAEKNGLKLDFVENIFDVPFQRSPFSFKNIKAYKMLKKIINEGEYDVIHCNTPVGGILTRMAAKKARKKGAKVIYMAHGFHFYKGAPLKSWLIWYPIEKHFAKKCDIVVTINHEDYLFAKEHFKTQVERIHGVGVDSKRYVVMPTSEKKKKKEEYGYSEDDFILLTVGELLPNKNQIQVIKAVEKILSLGRQVKLIIAGNGQERAKLEEYVFSHNLSGNVKFIGYCTHLEDYQSFIDVGVSCSIREGLGLNVIESMMAGNVVVATKNRGHNELIIDGESGFLVDVHDNDTLADRIIYLMDNPQVLEMMSRKAYENVNLYSVDNTTSEFKNILGKLFA